MCLKEDATQLNITKECFQRERLGLCSPNHLGGHIGNLGSVVMRKDPGHNLQFLTVWKVALYIKSFLFDLFL